MALPSNFAARSRQRYQWRAYDNGDDGFDFWQPAYGVTVTNSWSFHNGVATSFNNRRFCW
jgi:hypothetical protein